MSDNATAQVNIQQNVPVQPQVVQAPQQMQFDPSVPNRTYGPKQWTMKEDWYSKALQAIRLPTAPTPADVQQCALQIDGLLTVARLDQIYCTQSYNEYELKMKVQEKESYITVQQAQLATDPNAKLTVDTIKSLVAKHMNSTNWDNTGYSLYQLFILTSSRKTFMDGIVKSLEDKKDFLITHSGILKIENSLSNMQSSAPRNVPNVG